MSKFGIAQPAVEIKRCYELCVRYIRIISKLHDLKDLDKTASITVVRIVVVHMNKDREIVMIRVEEEEEGQVDLGVETHAHSV